ncbi:transcriptional antiterminator [Citrobacter werkmanii]|nr:transcriptional antiterminator [Citrobacter werkmanii]
MNATAKYHPIDCDLHDYLEVACLYHYWLHIELTDGTSMSARALTTCTTRDKEEFLLVEYHDNQQKIRLDRLSAIATLTTGATFSVVNFR